VNALDQSARILAECLLNSMAEGVAIAVFAWVVVRFFHGKSSSTRFAVWFSALIAIAALPWLHGFASSVGSARSGVETPALTLPGSWVTAVVLGWALIAGFGLVRVVLGLRQIGRLRASSKAIDPSMLDAKLQQTSAEFKSRNVTLAVSEQVQAPAAIGFFKPLILIPAWCLRELSPAELNPILIHELAHLRRWDDWTNLAQKALRAVFFFHPAVWWLESQLSLAREMACDDIVLAQSVCPHTYAGCLVSLAEKSFMRRGLAMAQAAVSRMSHTAKRVSQILDGRRSGTTQVWKPALGLVAIFSAACLVIGSKEPEMIGFQDSPPSLAAAAPTRPSSMPVITAKWSEPTAKPIFLGARAKHQAAPLTSKINLRSGETRVGAVEPTPNARIQPRSIEALLPATGAGASGGDVAVQTLLIVVENETDGPSQITWTFCVWRVDSGGQHAPIQVAIPAKSI
jgi:beta-lactamase regulating signal transducer with metallopeptidase domain